MSTRWGVFSPRADGTVGRGETVGADDPFDWRLWAVLVACIALAASITGLHNGFAYDDRWIIAENARVHTLRAPWHLFRETYWPNARGAALYRPMVILVYALQWAVGGGRPLVYHLVNISLYVTLCVMVYWLALQLLPRVAATSAAALFAAHPVHVEAVGNAVGQAELWAACVVLAATALYVRARREGLPLRAGAGTAIAALYAVGMFFKEHVIVLPALFVAVELFVVHDPRPWRERLDECASYLLKLALMATVFLAIRTAVLSDVAGDTPHFSLQGLTMAQRAVVMLGLVPEFGRLLLWPARLYADYSPALVHVHTSWHVELLPGILLLGCTALLAMLCVRRAPRVAFGLAWIAICLLPVANILLPTGILIAERTLLLPSVGAMLAVGVAVGWMVRRLQHELRAAQLAAGGVFAALVMAGTAHSAERQRTWRDDDHVFETLAFDAPLNFRSHYSLGGRLFEKHRPLEAELEWRTAIALLPGYHAVHIDLAHKYREAHVCQAAIPEYHTGLAIAPASPLARAGLVSCHLELRQWHTARTEARVAIADGMYRRAFDYMIEVADSALVATDSLDGTVRWTGAHRVVKP